MRLGNNRVLAVETRADKLNGAPMATTRALVVAVGRLITGDRRRQIIALKRIETATHNRALSEHAAAAAAAVARSTRERRRARRARQNLLARRLARVRARACRRARRRCLAAP